MYAREIGLSEYERVCHVKDHEELVKSGHLPSPLVVVLDNTVNASTLTLCALATAWRNHAADAPVTTLGTRN